MLKPMKIFFYFALLIIAILFIPMFFVEVPKTKKIFLDQKGHIHKMKYKLPRGSHYNFIVSVKKNMKFTGYFLVYDQNNKLLCKTLLNEKTLKKVHFMNQNDMDNYSIFKKSQNCKLQGNKIYFFELKINESMKVNLLLDWLSCYFCF